jgi:triosephosphate isomerase
VRHSTVRRPLLVANWKMNLGRGDDALDFVRRIRHPLSRIGGVDVVLCPPFTVLAGLSEVLRSSAIALGAQNMHWEDGGAHTGEISPSTLSPICQYVILGHSERRTLGSADDTDDAVNRKGRAALAEGLTPIVCVGENLDENRREATDAVVGRQVKAALAGVSAEEAVRFVIAYEPIWAIGSGGSASPAVANRTIGLAIRGTVSDRFGESVARQLRVLYGGSVTADNIADFIAMPDIDGALVGGASLDSGFVELVRRAAIDPLRSSGD